MISQHDFVRLLFKSGICKGKGSEKSQFYDSNYSSQVQLTFIRTAELDKSDPFADIEEDEDELEQNELVDYSLLYVLCISIRRVDAAHEVLVGTHVLFKY